MALGGTNTADVRNPLDGLFGNPAGLSSIERTKIDLSAVAGFLHSSFDNRANDRATLHDEGLLGSAAIAVPVGPFRFGLGVNPDIALRDRWHYRDTPGGADGATTYGRQPQESEIILLRTALGASWQVTPQFAVGASVGLLYNKNQLKTSYAFQSQPVLRTVKTLLDMETEGYGWNVQAGMLWKPLETLQLGLSYTTQAKIGSDGRATGNAGVQLNNLGLGAARPDFAYDAEVTNVFPQQFSFGVAWRATPKLTVSAQLDWINWQNAFDTLEVRLRNGNNRDLNGLVGSDKLDDNIPLDWKDQFVIRAGVEYHLNDQWSLRAGYSYGRNPIPARTLMPLTAAIMEHTVSAGLGFKQGPVSVDLAYQWQIPNSEHTGQSDIAAGEYADSTIRVSTQWVGLTTSVEF
jgi:long-chain fatty acid transport protein